MKTMKYKSALTILLTGYLFFCTSVKSTKSETIKNYVPNEETAIKIAEAVWLPIYGNEVLKNKPFVAKLVDGKIWRVEGSIGLNELGGVPIIEIQKSDCKILKVTHTK